MGTLVVLRGQIAALGFLLQVCFGLDPVVLGGLLSQERGFAAGDRGLIQGGSRPSNGFLNHLLPDLGRGCPLLVRQLGRVVALEDISEAAVLRFH